MFTYPVLVFSVPVRVVGGLASESAVRGKALDQREKPTPFLLTQISDIRLGNRRFDMCYTDAL